MVKFTPPNLGKLKPATIGLIAAGIFLVAAMGTSVFIVDQAEEAVITRLGRYYVTRGPGLRFKLPFGIDRSFLVNVRAVHSEQFGFRTAPGGAHTAFRSESTMLTGDLNIVDVEWIIQYRIVDSRDWTFNVMERERTIRDVSRSVINMLVGDRAIMDILSPARSEIEIAGIYLMNETFEHYGLGINVMAVHLQNVTPPAMVRAAFEDVNMAIQDMNRLINEGQQIFNEEIPRARGEAERTILVAQGYATERVNRALGNATRFNSVLAEYRNAPDVTRQRLYFEMMESVFTSNGNGNGGLTLIDRNLSNFIPLMNINNGR
ncbi:MAG: FtsH protease activity modulator HflK [Spirochaetes bacterium]|nr:FtsH protease activity modulator HflK [Spirochaetota bacterium]